MVAATRDLAAPEPPPALWTRIEARLDEKERPRRRFWLLAPVGAFAAAALVLALRLGRPVPPSDDALLADAQAEFQKAEQHYARAALDLRALSARERERWPDEKRRRFDDALVAHRDTVERSRREALARPVDPEAQERLYGAYRREIAFLQDALMRSAAVDP
jgi:hypothetical protein